MNTNRGLLEHNPAHPFPQLQAFQTTAPNEAAFFNGLDASSSKQLAALSAAANARRAQQQAIGGPTSGINPSHSQLPLRPDQLQSFPSPANVHQTPFPSAALPLSSPLAMQPSMSPQANNPFAQRPQLTPQQLNRNRRLSFLQGLSKIMASRGTPLPSTVTGVEAGYDPSSSPWRDIEPASELGGVKLAGRDVDLYRLWGIIFSVGGVNKVQQQGAWANLLPHFGLPEQLPHPQENGNTSTAQALAHLYMKLLGAFDEFYYRGMSDAQRQALIQQGRGPFPTSAGGASASFHGHNMSPPGSSGNIAPTQPPAGPDTANNTINALASSAVTTDNELDDARKRKSDEGLNEEANGKRRKTDSESPEQSRNTSEPIPHSQMAAAPQNSTGRVKARRKIEYLPLAREVETAGGRDITLIQNELQRLSRGQQLRDINDWGKVYVDALTMSLRSRLSVELSYGLTTLIILSTMRSQGHDTGFLITQCGELLDELLDLLEDLSFPNGPDADTLPEATELITNKQLVGFVHDEIAGPFATEKKRQGDYDPAIEGPMQRRADLIRLVLNILRNLTAVTDNQAFMAQHPILVDLLLRLTSIRKPEEGPPAATSDALGLPDLIAIRKDVLNILVNLGGSIALSPSSKKSASPVAFNRRARLIFELVSSYLVDPNEAVSPFAWIVQSGLPMVPTVRAPLLPDAALEVFTRISQPDANRKVISRTTPQSQLWDLFEALVHRLPSSEHDYKTIVRDESWMSYLEKLVLSLYSLAFLMPPELKKRVKDDRRLSFAKVMLRFVKRVLSPAREWADFRMHFVFCARRSIETMKVIDDGDDAFDAAQPSMPTLSFGMGYGEAGDKKAEKGDGLLGGHEDEILWSIMLQREMDDVMFSELESLSRIESEVRVY